MEWKHSWRGIAGAERPGSGWQRFRPRGGLTILQHRKSALVAATSRRIFGGRWIDGSQSVVHQDARKVPQLRGLDHSEHGAVFVLLPAGQDTQLFVLQISGGELLRLAAHGDGVSFRDVEV